MAIRLYNTLTQLKEPFEPLVAGKVGMYVCGVTVYDMCHIGHARVLIVFDIIYRYLRYCKLDVTFVRNFTDVDDKIIKRANETGQTSEQVAETFIQEFYADADELGVLRPTFEPKATEHMQEIIGLVSELEKKGIAYEVDGDVYFEVSRFPGYGKLSNRDVDKMLSGARVEIDERKKSPVDFALWKKSKPGEPSWDSPWGPGRPGWHIECSAMSQKHLGRQFDIHGGGKDLIFPHHENEIAQSEAASGAPFVKYWLHNGFVQVNAEKMSKSLGNFFTIRDVIEVFPPEAIRLFMVSSHYRSPIDYSDAALQETMAGLERLYGAWEILDREVEQLVSLDIEKLSEPEAAHARFLETVQEEFLQAMNDDFNTAKALGHMFELVRTVNTLAAMPESECRSMLLSKAKQLYMDFRGILGVPWRRPADYRASQKKQKLESSSLSTEQIQSKIDQRTQARNDKDFQKADALRDELVEAGVIIKDSKDGTTWELK